MKYYNLILTLMLTAGLAVAGCKKDPDEPGSKEPIVLECAIGSTMTLVNDPDRAVDYIVPCIVDITAQVTVEAGTVIEFEPAAGFRVDENGAIAAQGNASAQIVFQGVTKSAGSWRGIYIASPNINNVLEYVTVRHAGGDAFNSNGDRGSVILYADGRLSVRNSTLEMGAAYGLNSNYENVNLTFANNTITSQALAPVRISARNAHLLDAASAYTGNGEAFIHLYDAVLNVNSTWQKLSLPYRMFHQNTYPYLEIPENISLTLIPGTVIEFAPETAIFLKGALIAQGTATEPIVFTGSTPNAGAWTGLQVDGSDVRTVLDHVEIAYAGGTPWASDFDAGSATLYFESYLSITNSVIRDGLAPCGINTPNLPHTLINQNNTFVNITTDVCQ